MCFIRVSSCSPLESALEVERIVKEWNSEEKREPEKINGIINVLVNEYAYSTQANSRKGGLIGLAATAIALMDDIGDYLNQLLPPVLKCFEDQQNRVRYYACEALYNITKVGRIYNIGSNETVSLVRLLEGACLFSLTKSLTVSVNCSWILIWMSRMARNFWTG